MAALLLFQQGRDDGDHVHVAAQVVGFHEGAVRLLGDVPQMGELDVRGEALRHGRHVVVQTSAQRPGAERQAVGIR
jgi:hypothetical protein